ncbi:tetratricopeptide repeat protein [Mariniblastus sp.]|nr:tetratricopeptide repeat protein [Mariniblastus sp.]
MTLALAFCFSSINISTLGIVGSCVAQTPATPQDQQSDLAKAMKYHSALLRRPNPGYLYDRFYNSWLDTSSQKDLKQFLVERAKAPAAQPADRLLLAFFYAKQGNDVEALQQFRVALQDDSNNAVTLYEMAVVEARTLDFESALANLSKAASLNSTAEEGIKIAQLRGKLLVRNRQIDEAAKVWDELIRNNPDDMGLMEDLIEVQISEGMFDQAQALSETLIAKTKDPFQKVIRTLRKGDILQRGGNQAKALEVYGSALPQVGMDSWIEREILSQVEKVFRRDDNLIGLDEYFVKLTKANNARVAIQKSRAKILNELGQVDEAIEVYEKIIELTPGSRENREAFINLLISSDKNDRAVKQMESLIALHSKDAELQLRLAELCNKIPNPQKAKAALDKFIALSADTEYSYLRAARLFEKFEDSDNAKTAFQSALEKFQSSDAVKEAWADFLFRSGEIDEAVKVWKELATGTDRAGLVRLARLVSVRNLNRVALNMLLARYDDFKLDSIYLGQLCTEAIALKKFSEAVNWATERVRLAKTSGDLDSALPPAILIINGAKKTDSVIESLRGKPERSAVETCLLVELLERASLEDEAGKTLRTSFEASKAAKQNQDIQILAKQRVRMARGRQDWTGAAKAAREVLDLPGGRKSPNVRQLIELYVRAGDDKAALEWIPEWKRLSPGSLTPWLTESTLLDRAGKSNQSIAVLRAATQKFPDDPDLFGQLAEKYLSNGQTKNAQRIYWRQYEDSEKLTDKIRWAEQLARLANQQGDVEELVEKFQERRKNNPQSIEPLLSIAQTHRIAGNYEERRAALFEATRLKKNDLSLLLEIARLEESEGDWEKAIQTLERASLIDKTDRAKQKIAQIYLQYGETQEGLARLLEIAGGRNASADDVEKIAVSIARNQNWDDLLKFLAPNVARFPNNYRLAYLTAIANEEAGDTELAKNQFLKLAQVNQEISTKAAAKSNRPPSSLYRYKGTIPQAAIDLMIILTATKKFAYQYRQSYATSGYSSRSTPTSTSAYLPNDIKSCVQFSLYHLGKISQDLSDDEREELRQHLERIGVENSKLLLAGLPENVLNSDSMAFLNVDPDNKSALAASLVRMIDGNTVLPQEICLKASETFQESFPALGFFAASKLDQTKPENQHRLFQAIKRLAALEEPNLKVAAYIGRTTYRSGSDKKDPLEKHRAEMNQLLLDWYPKLATNPHMSRYTLNAIVSSLQKGKSPEQVIEFLDREIKRFEENGSQQPVSSSHANRYRGNLSSTVALPSYPPGELIVFPRMVYSQLKMPRPNRSSNGSSSGKKADALPASQVALEVNTAQDPMMKVLLKLKYFYQRELNQADPKAETSNPASSLPQPIKAAFGDQVTDAKSAIDQLLQSSKTNVDAWYLSAALAVHEKRWDDAAASLEMMRSLPMTATTRHEIDGHLVALATVGLKDDLEDEANEQVVKSARTAALRLRRGKLPQNQLASLIKIFETLNLNAEAEKLERRIAAAAKAANANANARNVAIASAVPTADRIAKLTKIGKTDAAARLLSQEFQVLARTQLDMDFTNANNNNYKLDQFKRKVKKYELKKELLAKLDPGKTSNARKLGTWAFAYETFDQPDVALGIYEKIIEASPRNDAARLRYVVLKALAGDKQAFADNFPQVRERARDQFMAGLLRQMASAPNFSAENLLSLAESVIEYKERENGDSINEAAMSPLLKTLGSRMSIKANDYESIIPSPYDVNAKKSKAAEKDRTEKSKQDIRVEMLAKKQRELHDRVALRMIDSEISNQRAAGFTALLASTQSANKPIDDKMVELALKSINNSTDKPHYRGDIFNIYGSSYGYTSRITKRKPVEFLARHYGFSEVDHDQQVDAIAETLESQKLNTDATKLRNLYSLCRATNDDFTEVARELIDTAKAKPNQYRHSTWRTTLSMVVDVWKERNFEPDISQFVIDYGTRKLVKPSKSSRNGTPYRNYNEPVTNYVKELAQHKGLSETERFMTKFRLEMLGTEEEQRELSKLCVDQNSIQKNWEKVEPAGTYFFLAASLKSRDTRETFWLGVREMKRCSFFSQKPLSHHEINQLMYKFDEDEVDLKIDWLRQSGAMAGLPDFDPLYNGDRLSESVWAKFLDTLRYQSSSKLKTRLKERLSKKENLTFGEKLLMPLVEGKPANIYQLLGAELKTFKALPEKQQARLAKFASEVNDRDLERYRKNHKGWEQPSANNKTVRELCSQLLDKSAVSSVAKLMQTKQFNDLGLETSEFEGWATNLLGEMDLKKPKRIVVAAAKISRIAAEPALADRLDGRSQPFKSRLIQSVVATDISFDSINFILTALVSTDFEDVSFNSQISRSVSDFLKSHLDAKWSAFKKEKKMSSTKASVEAVKQLITQFGELYGDREMNALIPELRPILRTTGEPGKKIGDWLQSDDPVKYPKIKNTFRLAYACNLDKSKKLDPNGPVEAAPYLQELLAYVSDDSIPLQSRSRVAVLLIQYGILPVEGVGKCSHVIAQAYDAGQVLESATNQKIFNGLKRSDDTPDIKAATYAFAKSVAESSVRQKRNSLSTNDVVHCMKVLDLNGDKAEVRKLLKLYSISYMPDVAVALIELGYFIEAKKQCETIWSEDFLNSYHKPKFTKALESQLPEFVEHYRSEGDGYFAEVYFSSMPNVKGDDAIKTTSESRLKDLAERFSVDVMTSQRKRQVAIVFLAESFPKSKELNQALKKEIEDLSIESLFSGKDQSDLRARLLGVYLATQIQREDFESVDVIWEQIDDVLATMNTDNPFWKVEDSFRKIGKMTDESLYQLIRDQTPEQLAKILPMLRKLNQPSYQRPLNMVVAEVVHLMAGRVDDLAKFRQEHADYLKANDKKAIETPSINKFLDTLYVHCRKIKTTNPEAAENFIVGAWQYGSDQGFSFGSKKFVAGTIDPGKSSGTKFGLERLRQIGVGQKKKMMKYGPELARINSVNGGIWLQLARIQVSAGKDSDAAESFKKSIEDAKDDMKQAKFNRRVEYAKTLVKLKRIEEAKKMIKDVPADQLFKANKVILETLEKTFNEDQ